MAMTSTELTAFAAFARELAAAARGVTLPAAAQGIGAQDKNAGGAFDPVTDADRAAERVLRERIVARFPDHGVAGEEYGVERGDARFVWSLDPIDGTRSFICGLPSWTTLIALVEEGEPVLGVIDAPALDALHIGLGGASQLIGPGVETRLAASGGAKLSEARLATTDPYLFTGAEADGFERVRRAARVARYGLDAYAYARLAAGGIDVVVESQLHPHDYQALIPVVRGAGGYIGDWEGGTNFSAGRVVAAASERLYEETVRLLAV